jgi:xylulokinase
VPSNDGPLWPERRESRLQVRIPAVVSVDVGTSSTKGVLVSTDGQIRATAVREHAVDRPQVGWVEMDASIWWSEYVSIVHELLGSPAAGEVAVEALGVSGMGPCALVTDARSCPLRPAILYGVDTRASAQIASINERLGSDAIFDRCGSVLSSQSVGPKLEWIADNEPAVAERARRLFMPSSWLVYRLTGEYVLDFHSASQCTPFFDTRAMRWHAPWVADIAPWLELPRLRWPGEQAGVVSAEAAELLGITPGIPVIAGTIDAWMEAISANAQNSGDLMLMYGTTMFLVNTVSERISAPAMWGTIGALPGTHNLAGGMATSGGITAWLRNLTGGAGYSELTQEAAASGPGANGLLMLPYFAGERTPLLDPDARGVIIGLTLSHTRGDLYRAALEATAFGVRHNIEVMLESGGDIRRIVALGGGAQGGLWTQIVSDVIAREQVIPDKTIGASYGGAFLAAALVSRPDIAAWNPTREVRAPEPRRSEEYSLLYALYRELYPATRSVAHDLARRQRA